MDTEPAVPAEITPATDAQPTPPDATEIDPMQVAIEADKATTQEPDASPEPKPKPAKSEAADTAKPGDKGPAKKDAKDANAKPGEQGKPQETALTKEQKEAQRQERSWKALEAEKTAFRQEKQAHLAQMDELKRELAQLKQQSAARPVQDENGIGADTWEQLAAKLKREGNEEDAAAAQKRADALRRQESAAKTSQNPAQTDPASTPQFQAEWQRHTTELITDDPTLNDPENPIVKAANHLLNDKQWAPFFRARPDGIRAAVEVARILGKSQEVDAARAELATAKAEIERLTKLTQPRGSHPSAPAGTRPKAANELTESDVMAAALAADEGG